jgi:NADH dehydrogenase FAD-containing subunit
MPEVTKEEFEAHIKELDQAIEKARIVLATGNQPPAHSTPLIITEEVSNKKEVTDHPDVESLRQVRAKNRWLRIKKLPR